MSNAAEALVTTFQVTSAACRRGYTTVACPKMAVRTEACCGACRSSCLWDSAKFMFSGLLKSNLRPSKRSGFRLTAGQTEDPIRLCPQAVWSIMINLQSGRAARLHHAWKAHS